jgi:hypothetical protein
MTTAINYADAARKAGSAVTTTFDTWTNSLTSVADQLRTFPAVGTLPKIDVTEAVERQFAFIQQAVDLNHTYARQLAEVAATLTGIAREQIQSVSSAVRDQFQTVTRVARTGADTVEQTVRDSVDEVEQAERRKAREVAKAERQERQEARDKARAPYADLTKAQLSELAAQRDLPKTGTIDELIERLVEADAS